MSFSFVVVGIVSFLLSQRGKSLRQGYEDAISRRLDDVLGAGYVYKYSSLAVEFIAFVSSSEFLSHALGKHRTKWGSFSAPHACLSLPRKSQNNKSLSFSSSSSPFSTAFSSPLLFLFASRCDYPSCSSLLPLLCCMREKQVSHASKLAQKQRQNGQIVLARLVLGQARLVVILGRAVVVESEFLLLLISFPLPQVCTPRFWCHLSLDV